MLNTLKRLCLCAGVTGNEADIADLISSLATPLADDCYKDKLGNLIAYKRGKSADKKIVFTTNMDIGGYIVTHIEENGNIRFYSYGKQNPHALAYTSVTLGKGVSGIALPDSRSSSELSFDEMHIDIGAQSKSEASELVSLGDTFTLPVHFTELQNGKIASHALDCRTGCALLVELMKQEALPQYDTYFVFTCQKNFAQRGAKAAAFPIDPDIVVSLDASYSECEENKALPSVAVGRGPAILHRDTAAMASEALVELLRKVGRECNVSLQDEFSRATPSNAAPMQACATGAQICAVTIPMENKATGVQVASMRDINDAYKLLSQLYKSNFEITGERK